MATTDQALDAANSMIAELRAKLAQVEADSAADRVRAALPLGSGQRLLDELATLRVTAQRRLELLRKCEWADGRADGRSKCPICRAYMHSMLTLGHKPDCPLAQELKEGKPEQYTEPIHDHGAYATAMKKDG